MENFRRAFIVRGRFPICRVHVKGSTIEVCQNNFNVLWCCEYDLSMAFWFRYLILKQLQGMLRRKKMFNCPRCQKVMTRRISCAGEIPCSGILQSIGTQIFACHIFFASMSVFGLFVAFVNCLFCLHL